MPFPPERAGGKTFVDRRERILDASAQEVFRAVCGIGGRRGYYSADWLWRIRGGIDRLVAGPGFRRDRRHPDDIGFGDAIDFWRVTAFERPRHLELRAEMKLPGVATLSFEVEQPGVVDRSITRQ